MSHLLNTINNVVTSIAIVANAMGTLVVLALVAVVNYDAIARGAFDKPFIGAVEVVQFSMVLIVFLQLPDVVRVNRLTRSDGFLTVMDKHWPRLSRRVGQIIDSVSCVFMLLVTITIWPEFLDMWETKDYFGVPGVFTAPWWPIKLVIFLSALLCSTLFALKVTMGRTQASAGSSSTQPVK